MCVWGGGVSLSVPGSLPVMCACLKCMSAAMMFTGSDIVAVQRVCNTLAAQVNSMVFFLPYNSPGQLEHHVRWRAAMTSLQVNVIVVQASCGDVPVWGHRV